MLRRYLNCAVKSVSKSYRVRRTCSRSRAPSTAWRNSPRAGSRTIYGCREAFMVEERRYRDRHEAGRILAEHVRKKLDATNAVVLALPRGGVPVGLQVARALGVPLDVFIVRKLGTPMQPELAM